MSYATTLTTTKEQFPEFELVAKSTSKFMRTLDTLLRVVSFGRAKKFMDMTTTVGYTVYTPSNWDLLGDVQKEEIVRHERVHMGQKAKYGFFFYLLYLFLPFPIGFAYFRLKFECEAYAESLRCQAEHYGIDAISEDVWRDRIVGDITGASYLWPWFSKSMVETWYYSTIVLIRIELENEKRNSLRP